MIGSAKASTGVVKGCSKNVIVVKSPTPMFSEALFILKDEPFYEVGVDSKALLKQAHAAARQYTEPLRKQKSIPWAAMLLSSAFGAGTATLITLFL